MECKCAKTSVFCISGTQKLDSIFNYYFFPASNACPDENCLVDVVEASPPHPSTSDTPRGTPCLPPARIGQPTRRIDKTHSLRQRHHLPRVPTGCALPSLSQGPYLSLTCNLRPTRTPNLPLIQPADLLSTVRMGLSPACSDGTPVATTTTQMIDPGAEP